jgi:hypothetical protein
MSHPLPELSHKSKAGGEERTEMEEGREKWAARGKRKEERGTNEKGEEENGLGERMEKKRAEECEE